MSDRTSCRRTAWWNRSPGQPYYALVWEGSIGSFYRVDERGGVTHLKHVMSDPGNKYAYLFALADPHFPKVKGLFRYNDAGKQMALTGFAEKGPVTKAEQETIDFILKQEGIILGLPKDEMSWAAGVQLRRRVPGISQSGREAVRRDLRELLRLRRRVDDRGPSAADLRRLRPQLRLEPDVARCGHFSSVFVPPCPNDSGSALGTAIDAQWH